MSKWEMVRLGDISKIVSGSTPKTNVPEYWDGNNNWVTPAEITEDTVIVDETQRKLTDLGVKDTGLRPFPKGTVLLSSRVPIGKVAIAGTEMYCNQGFKNLICGDSLYNKYLFWYLKGKTIYLNNLGRGATFKEISKTIVEDIRIPLAPFEIQKKIAAILDSAMEHVNLRKQRLAELDILIKSVFYDMFGDPVTNPKGWELKTLPKLVAKSRNALKRGPFGGSLKKEIFVDDGYLVYEQYHALNDDYSFKRYFVGQDDFDRLKDFEVHPGDILVSCSGVYLGKLSIVPKDALPGIINQALLKITLNEDEMKSIFFVWVFKEPSFKEKYVTSDRGSGIPNLPPMPVIKSIPFISPPIYLQQRFVSIVEKINEQKTNAEKSIVESQLLFDSLMYSYFE